MLKKDFIKDIDKLKNLASIVIYTGAADELCHYSFGPLKWRTSKFEQSDETMRGNYLYGSPVTNIEDPGQEMLRIIEHKWFTPERADNKEYAKSNIVTYEYPKKWEPGDETLYAIIDTDSIALWEKYNAFVSENMENVILCGKNASYDNFTMAETIEAALAICGNIIPKQNENSK